MGINNGSVVSSPIIYVGRNGGSPGTVTVDGAGSHLDNAGGIIEVGYSGVGFLIVQNGGEVASATARIGSQSGSLGEATVTGNSSQWNL